MIQIDMEMPKTCRDCPFWKGAYGCPIVPGIPAWQEDIADNGSEKRSEHCPLEETVNKKPVEPELKYGKWYVCGACKTNISQCDNFCRECGEEIDWAKTRERRDEDGQTD